MGVQVYLYVYVFVCISLFVCECACVCVCKAGWGVYLNVSVGVYESPPPNKQKNTMSAPASWFSFSEPLFKFQLNKFGFLVILYITTKVFIVLLLMNNLAECPNYDPAAGPVHVGHSKRMNCKLKFSLSPIEIIAAIPTIPTESDSRSCRFRLWLAPPIKRCVTEPECHPSIN